MKYKIDLPAYLNLFFSGHSDGKLLCEVETVRQYLETYIQETSWNSDFKVYEDDLIQALHTQGYAVGLFDEKLCCDIKSEELQRLCDINNVQIDVAIIPFYKEYADELCRLFSTEKRFVVEIGARKKSFEFKGKKFSIGFERHQDLVRHIPADVLVVREVK